MSVIFMDRDSAIEAADFWIFGKSSEIPETTLPTVFSSTPSAAAGYRYPSYL